MVQRPKLQEKPKYDENLTGLSENWEKSGSSTITYKFFKITVNKAEVG